MTRAVVYGLLVTALAQGVIAGIGYQIFGLEAPALLGALTGLLSTAPLLGTAFVWVPLGVGLVLAGHTLKGVLLLAWGFLLVHPTDNVLRPLLISSVTRVPFLLVMFGAIGGLIAFGLVGVFVGPVLLGVASSVWLEWAAEDG
jgi:predicted PurR-regulated permease PerM